jgi:hypothetical protein
MATTWTPERRANQAKLIRTWKPWEQSTGPKTAEGRLRVARNAWKGGHRQQLRELSRLVSEEVRQAQDLVDQCDTRWGLS